MQLFLTKTFRHRRSQQRFIRRIYLAVLRITGSKNWTLWLVEFSRYIKINGNFSFLGKLGVWILRLWNRKMALICKESRKVTCKELLVHGICSLWQLTLIRGGGVVLNHPSPRSRKPLDVWPWNFYRMSSAMRRHAIHKMFWHNQGLSIVDRKSLA